MQQPKVTKKEAVEWATAMLVLVAGATAGHYAAMGMNAVQWAGAAASVLGSITAAVAVRVWPAPQKAEVEVERD